MSATKNGLTQRKRLPADDPGLSTGFQRNEEQVPSNRSLSNTTVESSMGASQISAASDPNIDITSLTLMEEVVLLGLKDQQGYLSFLNDSISYVLRGCLLLELAFRERIKTIREMPRRHPAERAIEVCNSTMTGDTLLDETMRLVKKEKHSIAGWIDLLSGETWNPMKAGFQVRQVRERIAKGLVDKGVLRTEKKSFLIFDMATHPLSDTGAKSALIGRVIDALLGRGAAPDLRTVSLVAAATAANVLDYALKNLSYSQREAAQAKAEAWLRDYAFEEHASHDIVAGVLTVFGRMDSLLY